LEAAYQQADFGSSRSTAKHLTDRPEGVDISRPSSGEANDQVPVDIGAGVIVQKNVF
jgi:hypothetical protein